VRNSAVFDTEFWLTAVAAVPAGGGGALLGDRLFHRAIDWWKERRGHQDEPEDRDDLS
jgi:hypothetical protein